MLYLLLATLDLDKSRTEKSIYCNVYLKLPT
jgi:hypothetical protein